MKYIYQIGKHQVGIHDESVNELADSYGGKLTTDDVEYAISQLRKFGEKYWAIIDEFALLLHFMTKENSDAIIIEKNN